MQLMAFMTLVAIGLVMRLKVPAVSPITLAIVEIGLVIHQESDFYWFRVP